MTRQALSPGAPGALSRPLGLLPAPSLVDAHPGALTTYPSLEALARAIHRRRDGRPWRLKGGVGDYGGHLTTPIVQVYLDDLVTQDETWLCAAVVDPRRPLDAAGDRRDVALLHDALYRTLPAGEQRKLDPVRAGHDGWAA